MKPLGPTQFTKEVVDAIASVVGPGPVALHEPDLAGNDSLY